MTVTVTPLTSAIDPLLYEGADYVYAKVLLSFNTTMHEFVEALEKEIEKISIGLEDVSIYAEDFEIFDDAGEGYRLICNLELIGKRPPTAEERVLADRRLKADKDRYRTMLAQVRSNFPELLEE